MAMQRIKQFYVLENFFLQQPKCNRLNPHDIGAIELLKLAMYLVQEQLKLKVDTKSNKKLKWDVP